MSDELNIRLLGGVSVALGGVPLRGFVSAKARALLCYLAVTGRALPREALAALLWGDMPQERAAHSLRQALSNLQKLVGTHLLVSRQTIAFDRASAYSLDVERFTSLLQAAESATVGAAEQWREAVALYAGDFLAGFMVRDAPEYEAWVVGQREWLRQRAVGALAWLARHYSTRGEYAAAEGDLRRLLELDPWREEAHRQLMRVLAYQGQRDAAIAQYQACHRTLAEALGEAPAEATTALYQQIRAGTLREPARHVPPHQVPIAPTPLIGREEERTRVAALLGDPKIRLLTLTGPGGIGKTRLALQVAADLARDFRDGVFFVPLAQVRDSVLLVATIARALEIEESSAQPLLARLKASLREKTLLLVLDNFEQVQIAAPLLAELLAASPGLRLLVTSRASLRVRGERVLAVPPLAVPSLAEALGEGASLAEVVARAPAGAMFAEWAGVALPGFVVDDANARLVAEICTRLEGLPLAIELATARLNILSLSALLSRLDERLAVLTAGPRDLPPRQRTLRATIAWSHDLLSEPERALFRRLAVCVGGCALEAAQAIAGAPNMVPDPATADGTLADDDVEGRSSLELAALVENSLLQRQERADGTVRLQMLETIREYALERLRAAGEEEVTRRRHAIYFLEWAEQATGWLSGAEQKAWLDQLEAEHDNLRAMLRWAQQAGEPALGMRAGAALWPYWNVRGYHSEGRRWLEDLLAQPLPVEPAIRARALRGAGVLAFQQGDLARAGELAEASLATFSEIGDQGGVASALVSLGNVRREQGDYGEAMRLYERHLTYSRAQGDTRGIAVTLNSLGTIAHRRGELGEAVALFEESLALRRGLGDLSGVAYTLGNLAELALDQGELTQATAWGEEGLSIYRELGHTWGIARLTCAQGAIASAHGAYTQARAQCEEARVRFQEIGESWGIATALRHLGVIARWEGDRTQAVSCFERSLALYREAGGNLWESAIVLVELGEMARERGDAERARASFEQSLLLSRQIGNTRFVERCLAGLAALAEEAGDRDEGNAGSDASGEAGGAGT